MAKTMTQVVNSLTKDAKRIKVKEEKAVNYYNDLIDQTKAMKAESVAEIKLAEKFIGLFEDVQ